MSKPPAKPVVMILYAKAVDAADEISLVPDKKPGRHNSRKMVFDATARDLFMDICEKYRINPEREPIYGGREGELIFRLVYNQRKCRKPY